MTTRIANCFSWVSSTSFSPLALGDSPPSFPRFIGIPTQINFSLMFILFDGSDGSGLKSLSHVPLKPSSAPEHYEERLSSTKRPHVDGRHEGAAPVLRQEAAREALHHRADPQRTPLFLFPLDSIFIFSYALPSLPFLCLPLMSGDILFLPSSYVSQGHTYPTTPSFFILPVAFFKPSG